MTFEMLKEWIRSLINRLPSPAIVVRILALVVIMLSAVSVIAEWYDRFQPHDVRLDIAPVTTMLLDRSRRWTLDTVLTSEMQERFSAEKPGEPTSGASADICWMRINLPAIEADTSILRTESWLEWSRANIDSADLYVVSSSGALLQHQHVDGSVPVRARDIAEPNLVFRVYPTNDVPVMYLRISTEFPIYGSVHLWKPHAFSRHSALVNAFYGIFSGGVILIFLYQLAMYFSLRDISRFYYISYLLSVQVVVVFDSGYPQLFVDNFSPALLKLGAVEAGAFNFLAQMMFFRGFMETRKKYPRFDLLLRMEATFLIFAMLVTIWAERHIAVVFWFVFGSICCLTALSALVVAFRQDDRSARFLLLSWTPYSFGVIIYTLVTLA